MMNCRVFAGDELACIMWAEPRCGEDFCEICGDCLACYSGETGGCDGEGRECEWALELEEAQEHFPEELAKALKEKADGA